MKQAEIEAIVMAVGGGNFKVGGRRVERKVFYMQKDVTALGGKFKMIDETTDKAVGITNFPKGNILPKDMDIIVLGIKAENDTTLATPKAALYRNLPAGVLQNSELIISQDGVLVSSPLSAFFNGGTPTKTEDDYFQTQPFYIKAEKSFDVEIETPAGATVGVTTCLGISLDCLVLSR